MYMPRRTWITAFATAAATALLAGCGTEPTDPGSFTAPSGANPSGLEELSLEDAADRYLEIVQPYNEALEAFEAAFNSGDQDLATLTGMAGDTAAALETEIGQLQETAWPEEVQSHVDDLVAASEQALPLWQEAAAAESVEALLDSVQAAAEHDGNDAGDAIREALGLQPYNEEDNRATAG
jgi:hypothetical protein